MGRLRMVFRLMVRIPGLKGGFFPARCRTRRRRSSAALPFPSSYACFLRMSSRVSFPRLRPENLAGCSTGLRLPGFQSGFHLIQVLFTVLRSEEPEPPPRHPPPPPRPPVARRLGAVSPGKEEGGHR